MKRIITVVFLIAFTCSPLPACSPSPAPVRLTGRMSPEATVKFFFERYSKKDLEGMNSVVYEKAKIRDFLLDETESVKLISCEEDGDSVNIRFEDEWYNGEVYGRAVVHARYEIKFREGAAAPIENGENEFDFYLVKKGRDNDWVIVQWGLG